MRVDIQTRGHDRTSGTSVRAVGIKADDSSVEEVAFEDRIKEVTFPRMLEQE